MSHINMEPCLEAIVVNTKHASPSGHVGIPIAPFTATTIADRHPCVFALLARDLHYYIHTPHPHASRSANHDIITPPTQSPLFIRMSSVGVTQQPRIFTGFEMFKP